MPVPWILWDKIDGQIKDGMPLDVVAWTSDVRVVSEAHRGWPLKVPLCPDEFNFYHNTLYIHNILI